MPTETEEPIEAEAEESTTDTCDSCGCDCDREQEGFWAEGHDNVCQSCYYEITSKCTICQERIQPSEVSNFILAKWEFTRTGHSDPRPPGIYFILRRPFYTSSLIGSGWADMNDLLFIDRLPKRDDSYEISGHICRQCARPYGKILTSTYWMPKTELLVRSKAHHHCQPKWTRLFSSYHADGWKQQRDHIRQTILNHPEMLHDLEMDMADEDYRNLRKAYDLPPLRMHRDWLLIQHKGVKVYSCYPFSRITDHLGWQTMGSSPRHRREYGNKLRFAASSLPTYESKSSWHSIYGHGYMNLQELRAIVHAINQGILKPDGVHRSAKAKPISRKRRRKMNRLVDRIIIKQHPSLAYYLQPYKEKKYRPLTLNSQPSTIH